MNGISQTTELRHQNDLIKQGCIFLLTDDLFYNSFRRKINAYMWDRSSVIHLSVSYNV